MTISLFSCFICAKYYAKAFPGNKITNCFSHHKEVSNTNLCKIDINNPVQMDLEKTEFAFSAVIGIEQAQFKFLGRRDEDDDDNLESNW
jgi:hypothetical protein